jgi:peptidoglycan hydrolase-like protein with peptidoglycan-binding domain
VGELGLDLSFKPLLQRRVMIDRLLVRGIDVVLTRSPEKLLTLNGVPLNRIIPRPDPAEQPETSDQGWRVGVESVELRESRLIFQEDQRGDLEVDVERLNLADFQTWHPERPGRFELAARLNDIELNWSGEARPFADNITLAIDSRTEQADVPKVVRFTGPLGLDRRDGTYDADLKYEMTFFDSGRFEGKTVGTIDIKGVDYERTGEFALALERAKLDLDVGYSLSESGDLALTGQLATDLGRSSGTFADETRLVTEGGRVTLRELDASREKNGAFRLKLQPDIELEGVAFSGPLEISVEKLLELLTLLQSLSAAGEVSTANTGLGDYADKSVTLPNSDVTVKRLHSSGESFSLQSVDGQAELGLKTSSELSDIRIEVGEKLIEIERLEGVLDRLDMTSGNGRLALEMAGRSSLSTGGGRAARGEMKLGTLEVGVEKLGLQVQSGAVSVQLAASTQASGFSSLIYAAQGVPEAKFDLGAATVKLGQASLDAIDGGLRWKAAGDAALDALRADYSNGDDGAFRFNRAAVKDLQADEQLTLAASALTVDGLDVYLKRSLLEALFADDEAKAETAVAAAEVARAAVRPPAPVTRQVDVSRVQSLLTGLGYAPGSVDGRMGKRTAAAIQAFQRREGLPVDGKASARLLTALESRADGAAPAESASVAPVKSGAVNVRLGHLALTGSPVIRFRDDVVTPQVNVDAVFKQAEVRNLDTQKTGQRTDLQIVADVNEFTHIELVGWVEGVNETADLDLKAKLGDLQLSTFSPYIVEWAGVYLESGQLDSAAEGRARLGGLEGEIQIALDGMAFRPLSEEAAERVKGKVGVPLETAVGLLQDSDGRIALRLPLRGTVSEPDVDTSSAVNKAIGNALAGVFPPTMVVSLLSGVAKGTAPAFEPVVFAPGSAELDEAARIYADDIAEFLAKHPKLVLKACGRSTAQDMPQSMGTAGEAPSGKVESGQAKAAEPTTQQGQPPGQATQALEELAIERKSAVRRYLITDKGTDAKRVSECRSTFDASDQGSPRVELSL